VSDQAITILLADDHPVVREGLRGMLAAEPGIDVIGEAGSGDEAVTVSAALNPDVILMDLRMPSGDGVSAITRIRADRPAARIIVLTTYDTDADILPAVEAGATGYLLKDTPRADLVRAIRAAARGMTNAEIGRKLFISEATVKTHLLRACGKLGVSGRTAAVTKAIEIGALPAPGRAG
jgi:DNA-binding NarL/FixJ family response regulator